MGCDTTRIDLINQSLTQPVKPKQREELQTLISQGDLEEAEHIADSFFKTGHCIAAAKAYQQIIQAGYKINFQIEGLGNSDLAISRYEWFIYDWYDSNRKSGKFKGNVFDALSLCLCNMRNQESQIMDKYILWYEDMIDKNQSIQLLIGYAHVLYNRSRYEEAIKIYNKILKINPIFVNVHVSLAMLYQYRRIQKSKSVKQAKQILAKDPNNMYAAFIIARNQINVDEKIKKLTIEAGRFPQYVRIANDVGIAYGSKKMHAQAIVWYKKCAEIAPKYAAAFNNIGVRTQLLQKYEQALPYYLRACQLDPQYKAAHGNAIDIFDKLKYNDEKVLQIMEQRPQIRRFYFCYYLGQAYYDKNKVQQSIKWYNKAQQFLLENEELKTKHYDELLNSFGVSFYLIKKYDQAQKYYKRCIQLNPKYHMAYYNLGILYKAQNNVQKTIQMYKKAIQVNPRYHRPGNNLGNIYKDIGDFKNAIIYYKKAVEANTTYTLGFANLGLCYLKINKYQDAFIALQRAKMLLPNDNNNLSEGNKKFLKESLDLFDKEGQKWRKTGYIDQSQKKSLEDLIRAFQANFKVIYCYNEKHGVEDEKILNQNMLQIVEYIAQKKFGLNQGQKLVQLVRRLFFEDQEYFHILPQVFIQYFWNQTFKAKRLILDVQKSLFQFVKKISADQSSSHKQSSDIPELKVNYNMKNFNPPSSYKVNLFKQTTYFDSYESLYAEIMKVNALAEQSLQEFTELVQKIRKRSKGETYGVCMKMPKRKEQQFKVLLRIFQKMFKKEITGQRVNNIITKIDKRLKQPNTEVTLGSIIHEIMSVWINEVTLILKDRSSKKEETVCAVSDLLRGKLMFQNVEDLGKAIEACDMYCKLDGYQILQLDNRLHKPQTMDVVLKIRVNDAVCELQLAMKQDQTKYHFVHSLYEIERSPLGCIFGSYLFMSKGFNYPILSNCKDIYKKLKDFEAQKQKKLSLAAKFIVDSLEEKSLK